MSLIDSSSGHGGGPEFTGRPTNMAFFRRCRHLFLSEERAWEHPPAMPEKTFHSPRSRRSWQSRLAGRPSSWSGPRGSKMLAPGRKPLPNHRTARNDRPCCRHRHGPGRAHSRGCIFRFSSGRPGGRIGNCEKTARDHRGHRMSSRTNDSVASPEEGKEPACLRNRSLSTYVR